MVALIALCAGDAAAQERDAQVLRPGELRISVGAEYTQTGETFTEGDGTASDRLRLISPRYRPLVPLARDLADFFAATAGPGSLPLDPDQLSAGELSLDVAWTTRTLPLRVSVGVLPRIQVGVGLGIAHYERLTRRMDFSAGTLGVNPDPDGNRALFGGTHPNFTALGGVALLPLEDSPIGRELQARVFAATGEELALPEEPLGVAQLESHLDIIAPPRLANLWRPAYADADVRVELLRSFADGLYPPEGAGFSYRAAAGAAIRIPFTVAESEEFRIGWGPEPLLPGARVDGTVDLFLGDRIWLSTGAALASFTARDTRLSVAPYDVFLLGGEDIVVRRSRGNELDLWALPRLRLTREISVGATFRSQHWAAGTDEIEAWSQPIAARSRQSAGFSLRYTTLPATGAGLPVRPIEAMVGYAAPVRDSGGASRLGTAFLQVVVHNRLWGASSIP